MTIGIRDVARLAQVSIGTVSQHINHPQRVSAETSERIGAAIAALGFVPNPAARQMRRGISDTIGYLAPDVSNPHFAEIAEGVESRAAEYGLRVYLANSRNDTVREDVYMRDFEQNKVRGMIVSSHHPIELRLAAARDRGTPSVLVGQAAESAVQPYVTGDDYSGGAQVVRHLLEIGCRNIALIGGPHDLPQVRDRMRGASDAIRDAASAQIENIETTARDVECGRRIAREILSRSDDARPDAVFAMNDLIALGLMQELVAEGVDVPEEIAVAGYDDNPFAGVSLIPLTTVRNRDVDFGQAAVDVLMAAIDPYSGGFAQRTYGVDLVIRASTNRSLKSEVLRQPTLSR